VLALEVSQQTLFQGVVFGLVYAVLAAGFVLVYRSTGVLNFAQGEIGAFGVALFALFTVGYGINYWLALALAVAASAVIGAVIELTVVRRLFEAPRLVLLIATLGVAQLLLYFRFELPDIGSSGGFPLPFEGRWEVGDIVILPRELLVLVVAPLAIAALALFMTRTPFGLAVRASASNPDTARVYGISVKRTSTIVWVIAAAFAALTAILVAPLLGVTPGSIVRAGEAAIGPALLVRALVVSLIARMRSLPATIAGGIAVGVAEAVIRANVPGDDQSIVDVYLFLATLVLVLFVVRSGRDEGGWSLSARIKPIPERLRHLWYVRWLPRIGFAALFTFLGVLPFFLDERSQQFLWTDILIVAIAALPISMLTGWAGQLSLGQFAFVGLGALTMGVVSNGLEVPLPFTDSYLQWELPWILAALVATVVGTAAALVVGLPALRVRGLFLAVCTIAFAVACSNWLFRQPVFVGSEFSTVTPILAPPEVLGIDFSDRRSFYWLCFGVLLAMALAVARLRRTGVGRSMVAVRDNEAMAAASTVCPERMKLIAFTLAGAMGAFAGCLFMTLRTQVNPSQVFSPDDSIRLVATVIIGGLGSVAGPIIGALWVRGLPVLFGDLPQVQLLTSSLGLLVLLMYFPGGFMQIFYALRDGVLGWADRRREEAAPVPVPVPAAARRVPVPVGGGGHAAPPEGVPWLSLRDVSVRFGGNQAVDGVSLDVAGGELVGLIGTNGAGKSSLMNAVSGLCHASGRVEVLGQDVSRRPAYRRHRVGLGRGFQAARLYPDLTVRETIMVALEARQRSLLLPSLVALPPSPRAERRKAREAGELIDFLGLGRYADDFIANLSTGTRRIVELACLFALDARVLLLDEPTAGVAQRETEAFGPLLLRVQQELGAAMVVIEHDMPLIMGIASRVYCLEAGAVIAEGPPSHVRADPKVIASYLGTDERAVARSGAAASSTAAPPRA
jgi:ABC-type branched-subunit amino acid transport system permease subunit/ABC-type branched-subunit amino acid transport system ATPase component